MLWKENCLSFISRIRNYFPAQRVILHKAYWNEKFIEGEQIMDFPDTDLIRSHNNLLREYYAFFERAFPGIKVIDMGKKNYLSDKNHRWGLQPFHYEAGYYCDFLDKLFVLSGKA